MPRETAADEARRRWRKSQRRRRTLGTLLTSVYFGLHAAWVAFNSWVARFAAGREARAESAALRRAAEEALIKQRREAHPAPKPGAAPNAAEAARASAAAPGAAVGADGLRRRGPKGHPRGGVTFDETSARGSAGHVDLAKAREAPSEFDCLPAGVVARLSMARARTIVMLGDDFAQGIGDWVTAGSPPGLANHCLPLAKPFSRLRWCARSFGVRHSESADWVPGGVPADERSAAAAAQSCMDDVFHPSYGRLVPPTRRRDVPVTGDEETADVAVLAVGTMDTCPVNETATNVARAAEHLESLGLVVIVTPPIVPLAVREAANAAEAAEVAAGPSTSGAVAAISGEGDAAAAAQAAAAEEQPRLLPDADADAESAEATAESEATDEQGGGSDADVPRGGNNDGSEAEGDACAEPSPPTPQEVLRRLESRRDAVIAAIQQRWPQDAPGTVRLGPTLDLANGFYFCFGGRYFNGAGYREWARLWRETLLNAAVTVEAPVLRLLASTA